MMAQPNGSVCCSAGRDDHDSLLALRQAAEP